MQDWTTVLLSLANILLSAIVAEMMALIFILLKLKQKTFPPEEHQGQSLMTNYSLWKYQDGSWQVVENRCERGFQPGDPPARPGDYPGEIVRKPATRNC